MKCNFWLASLCLILIHGYALGQIKTPTLSPRVQITQEFGLSEISFSYARPGMRGRRIFAADGLIPYGYVWRAGANAATKITFGSELMLAGQTFPAGDYSILITPNEKEWLIEWYPYTSGNWQSYVDQPPFASMKPAVETLQNQVENLQIGLQSINLTEGDLLIEWADSRVRLPLRVEIHDQVVQSIERELSGPSLNAYFQAALYYHETGTELEKALDYVQRVTRSGKSRFFHDYREALILSDLNRKAESIAAARISLEKARAAGNDDFVRLNQKLLTLLGE